MPLRSNPRHRSSGPLCLLALVAAAPLLVLACAKVAGIDELEIGACKGGEPCFSQPDGSRPSGTSSSTGSNDPKDTGPTSSGTNDGDGDPDPEEDQSAPPAFACPTGTKGTAMVLVGTKSNPFCIDRTETTVAQYREFLDSSPSTSSQPSECTWNTTFAPTGSPAPDDLPQVNIDWCDARAYCAWAGKRLCGKVIDGKASGGISQTEANSPNVDQWYVACSAAGSRTYPYGNTMVSQACNLMDGSGGGALVRKPSGDMKSCVGGYDGVFDLLGNVWEWSDDCFLADNSAPEEWACWPRGGSYAISETETTCKTQGALARRKGANEQIGFRCCSN